MDLFFRLFGAEVSGAEVLDLSSLATLTAATENLRSRSPMTLAQSMTLGKREKNEKKKMRQKKREREEREKREKRERKEREKKGWENVDFFLPGGASAMVGATVVFPLDKVKTLLMSTQVNFSFFFFFFESVFVFFS